jgi:hypothetical protein
MTADYPRRLTRYYVAQLLWLVEYGTPTDLASFPPSIRAWVREVRACCTAVPTNSCGHTTAPIAPMSCDLLAILIRERNPLI